MTRAKILNVDDQPISRYIRTQTLLAAGYEVIEAASGAEALQRIELEQPQVVLLDMNMPDLHGTEVCRRIRAHPSMQSIIVVHVSATQTSIRDRATGLDGGADGYLVEPVEPELLLATIRSFLRLSIAEARLEQSLAETRELAARYQSLTEAIPHIVYSATAEGQWDYVSQQLANYANCEPAAALRSGWLELVHPEDRQQAQESWSRAVAAGEPFETEYRFRCGDGIHRWHLTTARPVRSGDGGILQWVGTSTDIHERKVLNQELLRRHREFVALAENSPDIIARYDTGLRYTYVNRSLTHFSALSAQEHIGKTNREAGWPPEISSQWGEALGQAMAMGQAQELELTHQTADGSYHFHARVVPEFDSNGVLESLLAITTDVTEHKRAELALRNSERKLLRLVESNIIGVIIADEERITFANSIFLEMVGYSVQDLNAGELAWRKMTPPEYLQESARAFKEAREHGACVPFEKEYFRKNGGRVPVLLGAAALDQGGSEFVSFVLNLRELKEAEAALRRTNTALQRSNEDLTQFAYAASHDLQEPLRTVAGYTDLLARQYAERLDADGQTYISFTQDAVRRMQILIQDLLVYSQLQSTGADCDTWVEMKDVVQLSLANLKNAREESGAVVLCGELPRIRVDAAQMVHVFQNLVGNSLKYRKPGETPRVEISAAAESGGWVFCVRDNGVGFEQKNAEKIFGVFKRLHGREVPGTGIGLAIVKKIVERYGGQVWAESERGQGAAFYFRLPSDDAAA